MTVRQVLIAARELILAGWCQRRAVARIMGKNCYCPMGAISKVCKEQSGCESYDSTLYHAVTTLFKTVLPEGFVSISRWNDLQERTQAEVVSKFTEAINLLPKENCAEPIVHS